MAGFKEARKAKGWNQREAAEQLGIPYWTYVKYEAGDREPSYETLSRIAETLGVTTDFLLGRENSRPSVKEEPTEEDDFLIAMHGASRSLNEEDKQTLLKMAEFMMARNGQNNE